MATANPLPDGLSTSADKGTVAELRGLLLAGQRLRQAVADRFGISLSESVVLSHLADGDGILGPGELVARMLVGSGTLTAVVDRLERAGYVVRRPHQHDRRRVQVGLTPAGRRVVRYAEQRMRRALDRATEISDPPPLGVLVAMLEAEADRIRPAPAPRARDVHGSR
ncbi:MAG: MarR family winged helix-turn-helix transcriptional regulator [Marmoricola sp.]